MPRLLRAGPPDSKQQETDEKQWLSELGLTVQSQREALGWSQERLAREAGVNAETVRQLERGITEPKPETLEKISAALGPPSSA
jgi:ribosome-binding protein aMBF1 (putative translation factor)